MRRSAATTAMISAVRVHHAARDGPRHRYRSTALAIVWSCMLDVPS